MSTFAPSRLQPPNAIERRPHAGFTLIELSVVMVIIGLILGGVFVGQQLIEAAQMRAVIKQIESYNTAVNTFKLKFGGLPGDLANADSYWPLDPNCGAGGATKTSNTCDGNGDGIIGGYSYSDPANQWKTTINEVYGVWNQLALAGLISGAFAPNDACGRNAAPVPWLCVATPEPPNFAPSYNNSGVQLVYTDNGVGGTIAGATNGKHVFVIAGPDAATWPTPIPIGAGNNAGRVFTSTQAYSIDSKIDDGLPYSGTVLGTWDQWGDYCGKSGSGKNVYTMTSTVVQGFPLTAAGCQMFFLAQF